MVYRTRLLLAAWTRRCRSCTDDPRAQTTLKP